MSDLISSQRELEELLNSGKGVLVLFYASWCPFSRKFLPIFEEIAKGSKDNFCRVLADEMNGCEDRYSIGVFPTVIYFENGRIAIRLDGSLGHGIDEDQFAKMADSCGLIQS
jgi:thioredoxin 1